MLPPVDPACLFLLKKIWVWLGDGTVACTGVDDLQKASLMWNACYIVALDHVFPRCFGAFSLIRLLSRHSTVALQCYPALGRMV